MARPYTVVRCATSLDGRLDDASPERLILSNAADLAAADAERARCGAILVGAETVRRDDPRLLVRDGRPDADQPLRVVVSRSGELPADARLFHTPGGEVLVHGPGEVDLVELAWGLAGRGVKRLLVEGGGRVISQFLALGLVDELQLSLAPFLVGRAAAPRWVGDGDFPMSPHDPMTLAGSRAFGDVVELTYRPGGVPDEHWMRLAVDWSRRCPPSGRAFSVGAVLVGGDGKPLALGHSREGGGRVHAEESAFRKAARLHIPAAGATLYSTLEPCAERLSGATTCAEHVLQAGVRRVVIGWREPSVFVEGRGVEWLRERGVVVDELAGFADDVRGVNRHLLGGGG